MLTEGAYLGKLKMAENGESKHSCENDSGMSGIDGYRHLSSNEHFHSVNHHRSFP